MLLTARVLMSEKTALTVPEGAVFQVQDRAYVYAVDAEMMVEEREIKIGRATVRHCRSD